MEFKGTKGIWVKEGNMVLTVFGAYRPNSIYLVSATKTELESNALLISKAPEMLDFINRISGEILRNDGVLDEKWYEQATQLIQEATEIKD